VTAATGLWSQTLEQVTYSSPAVAGKLLIVGCNSGKLSALNTDTGALVWSFMTSGPANFASPLVVGTDVYVAAGASLQRVDLDPLQWGSNWSVTCVDPVPPGGALG
jgi:outer membrane protein assembly factor BamB